MLVLDAFKQKKNSLYNKEFSNWIKKSNLTCSLRVLILLHCKSKSKSLISEKNKMIISAMKNFLIESETATLLIHWEFWSWFIVNQSQSLLSAK